MLTFAEHAQRREVIVPEHTNRAQCSEMVLHSDIENTLNFLFKKCLRPSLFQSCKNQYQFGKVITALPIPVNIKNANV